MADESWEEQRERLEMMAAGSGTWELSPNDQAAIRAVLDKLAELHATASVHNPRPPSPEALAMHERVHAETLARIGPEKAWDNLMRGLNARERMDNDVRAELEAMWDAWDLEREPHAKALLQMQLGETVASWISHAEALERELTGARVDTLGDALPKEMSRVRDDVLPYYTPEVNGQIAAAMMRRDLDAAAKALAEGDVFEMLRVYESLKGYRV